MTAKDVRADRRNAFEAELNLLKQLRHPRDVQTWRPTPKQREKYLARLGTILPMIDDLRAEELNVLHAGKIYRPRRGDLAETEKETLESVNREIKAADRFLREECPEAGPVKKTFEAGLACFLLEQEQEPLQRLYYESARAPDGFEAYRFDIALEIFDSSLIDFDADAWFRRSSELRPIKTVDPNFKFSREIEIRLTELFRSYVFGNWISVMAMARSIVEFAIHDRADFLGIDVRMPNEPAKTKPLSDLIAEGRGRLHALNGDSSRVNRVMNDMWEIKEKYGNFYLHAGKLQESAGTTNIQAGRLIRIESEAITVIGLLVKTLEDFYEMTE